MTAAGGDALSGRLLDQIGAAERRVGAIYAEQVEAIVAYVDRQHRRYPGDVEQVERGSAFEIAAALGCSQASARTMMADAADLVEHHPAVLAAVGNGELAFWVSRMIVNGTRVLSPEQCRTIDAEIATEASTLLPGQVRDMVDRRVAAIDADAAARRAARARADKDVFYAPRPDTMALFGATLPAEQATACYNALDRVARAKRADGDLRSIAHLMCDTLVERVTGARRVSEAFTVELQVVLSDAALLGADDSISDLVGYGAIPSSLTRELGASSQAWVRRLLTDPLDGTVVAADNRRRRFDGPLRDFILNRDRRCRNPRCSARIRDIDHRRPHATGGTTDEANGDGYCERCHYLRDHPGILVDVDRIGGLSPPLASGPGPPGGSDSNAHGIIWTGPSGKKYVSLAPSALGYGTLTAEQLAYRHALVRAALQPEPPPAGRVERRLHRIFSATG